MTAWKIIAISNRVSHVRKLCSCKKYRATLHISFNFDAAEELKRMRLNCKSSSFYAGNNTNLNAIRWTRHWSHKKIINGKNIIEFSEYEKIHGISLWWFADFWFFVSLMHTNTIYDVVNYIEVIENIIKKESPDELVYVNDGYVLSKIIRKAALKHKIKARAVDGSVKEKLVTWRINNWPFFIEYLKKWKLPLKGMMARLMCRKRKADLLFSTYASLWNGKDDVIIGRILEKIKNKVKFATTDIDYMPSFGWKPIKDKIKYNIPFEYYYSTRPARKYRQVLEKKWKIIENNCEFKKSLTYKGYNIWPLVKERIQFIFIERYAEAINMLHAAIRLIKEVNPKICFIIDETSLYGRSIIAAAQLKNIKKNIRTIGMQHGMIAEESFEYIHSEKEISGEFKCPLTDYTLVSGSFTKNFLTKISSYPERAVVITGQPRYDLLASPGSVYGACCKGNIYKKLRLDPNKKLVVFATQVWKETEAGGVAEAVFKAMQKLKDVNIVIKLHPREFDNINYYLRLAKKFNVHPITRADLNIFELLYACDAMITMHSSAGLDAILLDKPIIVVNMTGRPDFAPYVKEKAGLGAANPEGIACAVRKALFDKKTQQMLKKARKRFIIHHAYRNDSKSTQRVVDFILGELKKDRTK